MNTYKELWQSIFPHHYKDKYNHESGLSGGGGDYPVYDIHLSEDVFLPSEVHRSQEQDGILDFEPSEYVERDGEKIPVFSMSNAIIIETGVTLGVSQEYFNVPDDVCLTVKNKSTFARAGIDASLCTFIDNGFKGYLTIELINHAYFPMVIKAGTPILQVFAQPLMFPCEPYNGKYQHQKNKPVPAKLEN